MGHIRQYTNMLPQPVRFGLRRLAFRGSALTCPLCGNGISGLKPHGGGHQVLDRRQVVGGMRREDDRCPVCHGCDRTRMMMLYLERHAGAGQTPLKVLHVAPDYGLYLWLKRQSQVHYTGSDIDAKRYRHIENMHSADLTAAPFADASFDVVICSHVLEHIPDDAKAMREILRILKPGGQALLLVPLATDGEGTEEEPGIDDPAEQERRFGQWDHVRIYGRDDFLARMRAAGFGVTAYDPFADAPDRAEALHLNPLEILPVGRRPGG
ncbi:methyltransferase domain-containing protein [Rhodobacteraceae bacterium 2CG4]|uniref:Methyltransferase domain-containing protein n=1 Tax=Halovulum marinum TaxID=2662447 RepID=A0A6L5Z569_9RHOB|nr:class I SAM-dependent methyltransferase [Halovulum marinum]MSU91721.1 methyltransferase domain-containing protein [Halovulum marinum]